MDMVVQLSADAPAKGLELSVVKKKRLQSVHLPRAL
jgi:hypothetical protein